MTRRPERLKATKTYGSDHVSEKPKSVQENDEKPIPKPGTINTNLSKTKTGKIQLADKEVQISSNPEMKILEIGNKQDDETKTQNSKIQHEKKDTNQEFKPEWKKGLPKGFVTRTEMEQRVGKGKSLNNDKHQKPTVPAGFVTRKDMETRIKNRKTKSTKVSPMYTENNTQVQTHEKHQPPSIHKEQDQRVVDKPDQKHLFSKLEKRTQAQVVIVEKEDVMPKGRRLPKQSQNDDKGRKIAEPAKYSKPPLNVNRKSDDKTATPETNPKGVNKDNIKAVPDTNGTDRKASASTRKSSIVITPRMTSTAIPKASRQNAKTNNVSGMKLESVKILVMNANGKDDKSGTPAERRKNAIQNVVMKHMPNIVLFQEFSWVGITGKTWAKYPIPEHFVYKGHYDASIMYDATCINVQDLPASDIDTILSGLQSNANNRLKRTFPMDFNPVARMCVSRITATTKPGLDFICISWHGKSNETGGGRMKELKKIEYFEYWMEFLRNIREKYKLPILAAGDYNVDMYSIEKYVENPFKLCIYEASMRRTVKGIVDFCIVTEDLDFTDITWVNLERDTTVFHPNGILDHDPVVGSLTVSAIGASGAALGIGKKKSWPSPIVKLK